jgi:hypothetical protein
MWEKGERLPSQKPSSLMACPCGETFDSHRLEHTVIHVPHTTAAHAADGIAEMKCSVCEDCGWVCENHPDWGDILGSDCGETGRSSSRRITSQ